MTDGLSVLKMLQMELPTGLFCANVRVIKNVKFSLFPKMGSIFSMVVLRFA